MKAVRRFAWLPLAVGAGPALAHSPVPGIEGFYIGVLHPFSTPSQAILMLGLGLLVGSFSTERARWLLAGFLIASLCGLLGAIGFAELDAAMFAVALIACAAAALVPGKPWRMAMAIVFIGGLLIGDASVPDGGALQDRLFTMSGSLLGANLGLLYMFGAVSFVRARYQRPWVAIGHRVVAAWLAAIALVMLALDYAQAAPPS